MLSICYKSLKVCFYIQNLNVLPTPQKNNAMQFSRDHNPQSGEDETNNMIANIILKAHLKWKNHKNFCYKN